MTPPETITAAQFQALGALLWGEDWRRQAADALGVGLRNVQFWAAEPPARAKPIPAGVIAELCDMVQRLATACPDEVAAHVARHASQTEILKLVTAPKTVKLTFYR